MNNLIILTIRTFLIGAIVLGVLLFLPAWTLTYWQAWVFIVVFMGSANAIGVYLYLKDPELLERRKKGGPTAEQNMAQVVTELAQAQEDLRKEAEACARAKSRLEQLQLERKHKVLSHPDPSGPRGRPPDSGGELGAAEGAHPGRCGARTSAGCSREL